MGVGDEQVEPTAFGQGVPGVRVDRHLGGRFDDRLLVIGETEVDHDANLDVWRATMPVRISLVPPRMVKLGPMSQAGKRCPAKAAPSTVGSRRAVRPAQ